MRGFDVIEGFVDHCFNNSQNEELNNLISQHNLHKQFEMWLFEVGVEEFENYLDNILYKKCKQYLEIN